MIRIRYVIHILKYEPPRHMWHLIVNRWRLRFDSDKFDPFISDCACCCPICDGSYASRS